MKNRLKKGRMQSNQMLVFIFNKWCVQSNKWLPLLLYKSILQHPMLRTKQLALKPTFA